MYFDMTIKARDLAFCDADVLARLDAVHVLRHALGEQTSLEVFLDLLLRARDATVEHAAQDDDCKNTYITVRVCRCKDCKTSK